MNSKGQLSPIQLLIGVFVVMVIAWVGLFAVAIVQNSAGADSLSMFNIAKSFGFTLVVLIVGIVALVKVVQRIGG